MLTIKVESGDAAQINRGDILRLRKVLEKEAGKMRDLLVESSNPETFRFHQGVTQALEGVIRILPQ